MSRGDYELAFGEGAWEGVSFNADFCLNRGWANSILEILKWV